MLAASSPLVLLAETDSAARRVFARSLLHGAYRVLEVRSGLEAADRARAVVPDAIVASAVLEGLDGIALARRVKADPPTQSIPFVLLGGSSAACDLDEARAIVDSIVVQPCAPDTLRLEIDRLLRYSQSLRERSRRIRGGSEVLRDETRRLRREFHRTLDRTDAVREQSHELLSPDRILEMRRHLLTRIQNEYLEMPDLALTLREATRVFGIQSETCRELLDQLVAAGFLDKTGEIYRRFGGRSMVIGAPLRPSVLVVAARPDCREIGAFLRSRGFDFLEGSVERHAFEQAWELAPDAIVVDLDVVGQWNGPAFVQTLKYYERTRRIPLIGLIPPARAPAEGIMAKCAVCLVKPCPLSHLESEIRRVIARPAT